ncbi:rRNA maturation RNase YbeY [Clostridium tertium]|mgnify:FL=1|jgi:probable rRNA maturation factor|uniref:Endoribonuclease YbeY n=2 Tax=Bacillota TaxID=1239 RepID=A0A9X4B1M2_9CLOT|nr:MULTISPECIES: rRNA maturation RNase YbeY [Clostridium]MDB1922918.1 rRNA maturation RNase YbeY [Clostridium tertium]MDB1925585.1 rRNA maturation RNase YbeY [Clostridium tertium]MDB1929780.1 rRNA maturation RNase YbeY [Clostridium tertium]MDB1932647.1 rRNA maturation RNase YbeY [Clostridium tertium]MDB1936016.1 rRNA maturation RNase YbeY [Clostridium tertium]
MLYTENRQDKLEVTENFIERLSNVCDFALKEEGVECQYQISLLFVDNEEIREINNETRNIDRATDVLSFPMLDFEDKKVFNEMYLNYDFDETFKDGDELILGDMVLSLERALEQSEEYGHSYEREVSYLVVHSILHLLGYDHMEEDDKKRMRKREEEILNKLQIRR